MLPEKVHDADNRMRRLQLHLEEHQPGEDKRHHDNDNTREPQHHLNPRRDDEQSVTSNKQKLCVIAGGSKRKELLRTCTPGATIATSIAPLT